MNLPDPEEFVQRVLKGEVVEVGPVSVYCSRDEHGSGYLRYDCVRCDRLNAAPLDMVALTMDHMIEFIHEHQHPEE